MGKKVTLGGDRLGSGNKNKIALHNYERSTHNLSKNWASSMGAGILYPFMCIPAMRGDAFEIDLEAACRTIPTKGPLFGSFKMQLDVFQCPARLYQAILHNNPTSIGLKMSQVKFPMLEIKTINTKGGKVQDGKLSNSCLLKYMGMSGLGRNANATLSENSFGRNINAIPFLAYYDIFKNYYSNKQEQNAYVISPTDETKEASVRIFANGRYYEAGDNIPFDEQSMTPSKIMLLSFSEDMTNADRSAIDDIELTFAYEDDSYSLTIGELKTREFITYEKWEKNQVTGGTDIGYNVLWGNLNNYLKTQYHIETNMLAYFLEDDSVDAYVINTNVNLLPFDLRNIDDMRMKLLSHNNLGTPFYIKNAADASGVWGYDSGTDNSGLPYSALVVQMTDGRSANKFPLNGLLVKTYQSDLFNNWVSTEWIDGENGIAEITKISTSGGAFKIDALNLAEKLYNMLNRVAVSGGTYEDWQDAVYTQSPRRHIESPVYLGGMSNEVVFEEIVQSAPAGSGEDATQLGTLGGRGTLVKRKGGNIDVKVDEASFIIGIVSLTPRIYQTQGNKWYLTELQTMDDLHKPALDGIGFQNLIGEQLAWFDSVIADGGTSIVHRSTIGKVPAWINYMTDVDEAYGDFADDGEDGKNFMILDRKYDQAENNGVLAGIEDATTYIDPRKYNYAFAYTELEAQNFWVQIRQNIRARRLMSAKQIPNI